MKRMMSRLLVLALALAMVCSSAAIASAEEKDYAGKTFRIAWWGGDARHTMTTEMIAAFEKNYKNLKIEVEYCGFGDYANFYRAFRAEYNQTPRQYIQSARGK